MYLQTNITDLASLLHRSWEPTSAPGQGCGRGGGITGGLLGNCPPQGLSPGPRYIPGGSSPQGSRGQSGHQHGCGTLWGQPPPLESLPGNGRRLLRPGDLGDGWSFGAGAQASPLTNQGSKQPSPSPSLNFQLTAVSWANFCHQRDPFFLQISNTHDMLSLFSPHALAPQADGTQTCRDPTPREAESSADRVHEFSKHSLALGFCQELDWRETPDTE